MVEDLRRDAGHALRTFARQPVFTIAAVFTIALGVGASSTMFGVINAILLRPLPYANADRLVRIAEHVVTQGPTGPRASRRFSMTQDEFFEWRARTKSFAAMGTAAGNPLASLTTGEGDVRVTTTRITPSIFAMLGTSATLGRTLLAEDENPDANAVVISTSAWHRFFASDPLVLGRTVTINQAAYSIVGVMPASFDYPSRDIQFWLPLVPRAGQGRSNYGTVLALLADGVTLEDATREANAIGGVLRPAPTEPARNFGVPAAPPPPSGATAGSSAVVTNSAETAAQRFAVLSAKEMIVAPIRPTLLLLGGAVAVVLLIVCANVANLLLVRGASRRREIGVRVALGASRGSIVRQILTEALTLSLLGGVFGTLIALAGVRLVSLLAVADTPPLFQISANLENGSMLPRIHELTVDPAMIGFAIMLSLVAGVAFGIGPAFYAATFGDALTRIRRSSRSSVSDTPRAGARNALVVVQLVMATMLLVGAGLLVNSFGRLLSVNTGFDARNVVNFQLILPPTATPEQRLMFIETLVGRLQAFPGVESVGFTNIAPFLALSEYGGFFVPPNATRQQMLEDPLRPQTRSVTHAYLQTLGARLLAGRWFNEGDGPGQPNVLIVNRALAQRYFGDQSPIGELVRIFRTETEFDTWQIVGVVDDLRQARLDQEPFPLIYVETRQMLARTLAAPFGIPSIAVRGTADLEALASHARTILRSLDARATVEGVARLEDLQSGSLVRPRFYAILAGLFALIAGVIAAVGIYGVLAYSVAQRTAEIGVRMALGADRTTVLRMVLRNGLALTIVGLSLGLVTAAGVSRYLQGLLYGVTPLDVPTFAAIAITFAGVALLASYVPARRATRVDPVTALRCE